MQSDSIHTSPKADHLAVTLRLISAKIFYAVRGGVNLAHYPSPEGFHTDQHLTGQSAIIDNEDSPPNPVTERCSCDYCPKLDLFVFRLFNKLIRRYCDVLYTMEWQR